MLLADFVAFAHRTARGKRLLWRTWYQFLALRYPDQRWTFMNYGYRAPDGAGAQPPLALEPADEDNRSCIQLYALVARGAPVAQNDTPENKAKNRRIEITLVPNLDDLPPIDEALKESPVAEPAATPPAANKS